MQNEKGQLERGVYNSLLIFWLACVDFPVLQPRVVAVPWSRVCFPHYSLLPLPSVDLASYCCAWEPQLLISNHHCLLWTGKLNPLAYAGPALETPKGIWPTADGKPLGYWTGNSWSRNQIKQLREFGSPGCRYKKQIWYKAEALSFAPWLPLSSTLVLWNFDVKHREEKLTEKQLCKGNSFARGKCLILYK